MSRRLGPISLRNLLRGLRMHGWEGPWHGSKHQMMYKGKRKLRVPNPHGDDISGSLLAEILNQAGISREDWLEADL